jgi:hypothetical protein
LHSSYDWLEKVETPYGLETKFIAFSEAATPGDMHW